jgi:dihydroneopterin aldolase
MSDIGRFERRLVERQPRPQQADAIEVRGLRVVANHGVLPAEREHDQPFVVDVVLETDTRIAARSDDLADAIDYAALVDRIAELVRSTRFDLLEALGAHIADDLLTIGGVSCVHVRVHKPEVQLDEQVDAVAVTVVRSRPRHIS